MMLKTRFCLICIPFILCNIAIAATHDPLPSWNEGPTKTAILAFVKASTDKNDPDFVPPEQRIATFDQDGTLWVEQPLYTQAVFALDRIKALSLKHPEWKNKEPYQSIIANDKAAIAKFTLKDLHAILVATHSGMTVESFQEIVKEWLSKAKHPRWNKPYTALIYQPMLEVMQLLRANGYKTYIVTGGGQAFVRVYSNEVYGVALDKVIGSAIETQYGYDKLGNGILNRIPKLLLNNDLSGKPEDIYLFLSAHPQAAFGNSNGDKQMLEYTQAGQGRHLLMLVHHDDAVREYAYDSKSKIGTFSEALASEAQKKGWLIISIKNDWKRIFPFDK